MCLTNASRGSGVEIHVGVRSGPALGGLRSAPRPQEQLRLGHAGYLRQHPDAQAVVSDFLLFLLVRQPRDAVTFAAEFFGFFATNCTPPPALRSSHPPSPFRPQGPKDGDQSGTG